MRCPNCGHDNSTHAVFCANCGARLATSSPGRLMPGQMMNEGQYRIVRPLAKGGMGTIYLAANVQAFDRLCVIKEMLAYYEPGEEGQARRRFEREARTLATLKHTGIPDIYGYFFEAGRHFIVMEYILGDNLEKSLEKAQDRGEKGLPEEEMVRYGVEVCRVLEYLASITPEPIVHCDIKPANIIIDANSHQAILVDFGTAKPRQVRASDTQPDGDRASVFGTVGYAAPELYQGRATPRSDVFSLAATLYHLLTGDDPREHPFEWKRLDSLDPSLAQIMRLALEPRIDERLNAEGFRQQLEAYRASLRGTIQPILFPEGNAATTLTGVLDLSLRYWETAERMLHDGSLEGWLRHTLHNEVAADRIVEAIRRHADSPAAALDTFLRASNPRLPDPSLAWSRDQIDMGSMRADALDTATVKLTNVGTTGAHGEIASPAPWLAPSPERFALGPGQSCEVTLRIADTAPFADSGRLATPVRAAAADGQPVTTEVHARVRGVATSKRAPKVYRPPAAAAPATKQPSVSVRPSRPRPSRPPAQTVSPAKKKHWGGWAVVLVLVVLLVVVGLALADVLTLSPPANPERGIQALREGQWQEAGRLLEQLSPEDEAIGQIARILEETTIVVQGGVLQMGLEGGALDQQPVHHVAVEPFRMDRFEVTNVQYQAFVMATGHRPPAGWSGRQFERGTALHPVTGVPLDAAMAYADWAGKRLPTEAEWEWAARGREGRLYPWGNQVMGNEAHTRPPNHESTAPVGSYATDRTPLGIHDLAGNVREWTSDVYAPYVVPHTPPTVGTRYAIRGSSWRAHTDALTARGKGAPAKDADDLGFRCVR